MLDHDYRHNSHIRSALSFLTVLHTLPFPTSPMIVRMHDFQRAKRGGGVGVASESDKWPNGRVPYVLSAAYSKLFSR